MKLIHSVAPGSLDRIHHRRNAADNYHNGIDGDHELRDRDSVGDCIRYNYISEHGFYHQCLYCHHHPVGSLSVRYRGVLLFGIAT